MIIWNVSPEFSLGPVKLHWYGLLFATAFMLGYEVMKAIFRHDKVSTRYLDRLLLVMMLGTIIGARLGHTLLYEPNVYLRDPIRILKVWEGGLASHGAVMGILIALALYCRRTHMNWLWLVDRIAVSITLGSALVRIGNLFNSEIIGRPTTVPWAFVFTRIDQLPRHPSQLYESFFCLTLFAIMSFLYWKKGAGRYPGLLVGFFFTFEFIFRILIEFLKENQVAAEASMPLNLGQLLSFPVIIAGLLLMRNAWKKGPVSEPGKLVAN